MADVTIIGVSELTTPAADDAVPIWDTSAAQQKWIRRDTLIAATLLNGGVIDTGGFTFAVPASGVAALISNGVWTPDLQFGGANTGITYAARNGYYFRVGGLCFVNAVISLTSKGSAVGAATIAGLPVASVNNANNATIFPVRWGTLTATLVDAIGYLAPGASAITLLGATSAAASLAGLTDATFANTSVFYLSGFYLTS